MARGLNKVMLIGNVGKDPEFRAGNTPIAQVNLATSESWKDKVTGEKQERTEWHRVKFFGKLAEIVSEYVAKGSTIYCEGKLRTEKYTDKQGVEKYSTVVICDVMQMLGGRNDGEQSRQQQTQRPAAARTARADTPPPIEDEPFPDDIPF